MWRGKQIVPGATGTSWEIDGKGVKVGDGEAIVVIECKRHTKDRIEQDLIASLAYRMLDTGAKGGIIVSPMGLQSGAVKVAAAANIVSVHMNENSTRTDYFIEFLDKAFIASSDTARATESQDIGK